MSTGWEHDEAQGVTPLEGGITIFHADDEDPAVAAARKAAAHVAAQMQVRWDEERRERERWKVEDKQDSFYARLVAQMAAAVLGESAMGNRPKAPALAGLAIEYADAIMAELAARRRREAAVRDTDSVGK
jgi:hypothetical protein